MNAFVVPAVGDNRIANTHAPPAAAAAIVPVLAAVVYEGKLGGTSVTNNALDDETSTPLLLVHPISLLAHPMIYLFKKLCN